MPKRQGSLTKKSVESEKPTSEQIEKNQAREIWDDSILGFGLRIYPSGKKAFFIAYRLGGRQYRPVIAKYPDETLEVARKLAADYLSKARNGYDPFEEQRQRKTEHEFKRFSHLWDHYKKNHLPKKRSAGEDERRYKKWLADIQEMPIAGITKQVVRDLHQTITETAPYEANRVLSLISKIFNHADEHDLLTAEIRNPARGVKKNKERPRTEWLNTDGKRATFIKAVEALETPWKQALLIYLTTGLRNSELMRLRWDEIDIAVDPDTKARRAIIKLERTKSGETLNQEWGEYETALLESIPRNKNSPWIFPSAKNETGHLLEFPRKLWREFRTNIKMPELRIHDLRRTFGSLLFSDGVPIQFIGKMLNHKSLATTERAYAHLSNDPIRQARKGLSEKILHFENIKKAAGE
jgi:integrase